MSITLADSAQANSVSSAGLYHTSCVTQSNGSILYDALLYGKVWVMFAFQDPKALKLLICIRTLVSSRLFETGARVALK